MENMTVQDNLILNEKQIRQKISRIAFEIYENNYKEKKLVIAGISDTGYHLAKFLMRELKKVSPFELKLVRIGIDKDDPVHGKVDVDCDLESLKNTSIVFVDDVLSTGRTFIHSLKPFLGIEVKKVETAVLVNRSHKSFPISANYLGYELSTTLNDHIEVKLDKENFGVYLY
jgi:pyrimidine operon attenuation protein/uracil phosphoribosyltransferase